MRSQRNSSIFERSMKWKQEIDKSKCIQLLNIDRDLGQAK